MKKVIKSEFKWKFWIIFLSFCAMNGDLQGYRLRNFTLDQKQIKVISLGWMQRHTASEQLLLVSVQDTHFEKLSFQSQTGFSLQDCCITVKILKFGTPQTVAIIVLKIEKFDVTLLWCIQKMLMEW